MRPIVADDIRPLDEYNAVRDDMRKRVIALKRHRRIPVGDTISVVFENRETMLWQVHEMVRTENLTKPEAIAHECQTYSQLLPSKNELSATLYIEFPYNSDIRESLNGLIGIDEVTFLVVGDDEIPAKFDPGQYEEDRISSVHYLKFPLSAQQREAFVSGKVSIKVRIKHENYEAETELSAEARRSLCGDLRRE